MNRTTLRLLLFAAALFGYSADAYVVYAQQGASGDLSVVGEVSVNGVKGENGNLVLPDSRVHTAKGSSAVVSLGKLGRVEATEGTTMFLTFDEESIDIKLSSGAVVVETLDGILATVSTREAQIVSDTGTPSLFTVDVECGNTIVSVDTGYVRLRDGDRETLIGAGTQFSVGKPQGRCRRS
jgi:ferric-dicitrate binding protein FerR (iron transport regulator)